MRHSAIYQWLTAEPDPEVIVIDLRETWTVGPILRVLDRTIDRLADAAAGSRAVAIATRGSTAAIAAPLRAGGLVLAALGIVVAVSGVLGATALTRVAVGVGLAVAGVIAMQDDRDWATLRETRPVELAITAFEPPAPPDSGTDQEVDDADHREDGPSDTERDDST